MHSTAVGRLGEAQAWAFLKGRGWTLLAKNYRAGPKEIDLVVKKGRLVAFVEVKTRHTRSGGGALEAIGWRKQRDTAVAARRWISEKGEPGFSYRFDAIAVEWTGASCRIHHVADAWRVGK